jgi:hypothetical protein
VPISSARARVKQKPRQGTRGGGRDTMHGLALRRAEDSATGSHAQGRRFLPASRAPLPLRPRGASLPPPTKWKATAELP